MVDGEVSPNLLKQFGYWTHSVHHTVDGPVNTKNKEFSIIGSEFSLSKKSSLFLKMTIEDFSSEKNILVLRRAPNSDNWDFCFSEKSVLSLIEKAKGRGAAKAVTGSNGEGAPELETGKSEK